MQTLSTLPASRRPNRRRPVVTAITTIVLLLGGLTCAALMSARALAQQQQQHRIASTAAVEHSSPPGDNEPLLREYKGVKIGMTAAEARAALGEPADKSDAQDYYSFSDKEMAQIFYNQAHKVRAVSINYLGAAAPQPLKIVGEGVEPKADGSCYKMVKYPKAGYWVSYSRTAGDSPIVTIVMQQTEP